MKYSYFFLPLLLLLSNCRMVMKTIGESDCAVSGYVAEQDTIIECALGNFSMRELDTFVIEKGKGLVKKFKLNCGAHKLDATQAELVIGMEPDAPPMFFKENGRETGFDYELWQALRKEVFPNANLKVAEYGYDELSALLMEKKIDVIAGGYIADKDLRGIDWTEPYLSFGYCLITNVGQASVLKDLSALKGKRIGVYDDGETADWVRSHIQEVGEIVTKIDDPNSRESDWMQMLVDREVDAIIYDYPFAAQEIKDYKGEIAISAKNLNAPNDMKAYSFGLPCGNTQLLLRINEAILKFKASAQYANLVSRFIPNPDAGKQQALPTDVKDAKELYEVKAGETLSIIAQKQLGSTGRYKEIYDLNKDRLASPDIIYVGTLLKMPK